MDIQKITQLMDLLSRSDLTELHLQEGDASLTLVRSGASSDGPVDMPRSKPSAQTRAAASSSASETSLATRADVQSLHVFKSPMVGTFYRAGAPDAEPLVEVGTRVAHGQALGVMEAMKMLTEIESDFEGRIVEVLVENGAFVDYGQPLFAVETSAETSK